MNEVKLNCRTYPCPLMDTYIGQGWKEEGGHLRPETCSAMAGAISRPMVAGYRLSFLRLC